MILPTSFDFRRTVTALTFCGAGIAYTGLLVLMTIFLRGDAAALFKLAIGVEALLGVTTVGLAMTVALRQINAKFGGADFSATGGDGQ